MILEHAESTSPTFETRRRVTPTDGIVDVAFFADRREIVKGWTMRWSYPTRGVMQLVEQHYRANLHASFDFTEPLGSVVRVIYRAAPRITGTSIEAEVRLTNFT